MWVVSRGVYRETMICGLGISDKDWMVGEWKALEDWVDVDGKSVCTVVVCKHRVSQRCQSEEYSKQHFHAVLLRGTLDEKGDDD